MKFSQIASLASVLLITASFVAILGRTTQKRLLPPALTIRVTGTGEMEGDDLIVPLRLSYQRGSGPEVMRICRATVAHPKAYDLILKSAVDGREISLCDIFSTPVFGRSFVSLADGEHFDTQVWLMTGDAFPAGKFYLSGTLRVLVEQDSGRRIQAMNVPVMAAIVGRAESP